MLGIKGVTLEEIFARGISAQRDKRNARVRFAEECKQVRVNRRGRGRNLIAVENEVAHTVARESSTDTRARQNEIQ